MKRQLFSFLLLLLTTSGGYSQATDAVPAVPEGFTVSVYAREPLVRNPCAMAFDARGRLFIGQGPQYRHPTPESPTDRITLLIDADEDGVADHSKTFAEGFNSIQGLAWYGDQLWIANAPDLTVVRDIDGDDQADEYRRVYGGLGNLEHGLHGLVFAPDGRLYMSKGNSKGYLRSDSPERFLAPAPFADLWGAEPPAGTPTDPESEVFTRKSYHHGYHTPSDDWGTEGGVLRCQPDGSGLEIFSRGMRNMWDMNFDADFNWIGTDQDQDGGDRILNPFSGSHFGWGHPWSPHWTGEDHLPSMPVSGPVFHGSGTGVVSCASDQFPDRYHGAFFCADWLNRTIFVYRPKWNGALIQNMDTPKVFAGAPNGRTMGSSRGLLFDPTDIEFGPDGALWVLSWGHGYGSTIKDGKQLDHGRVYRISFGKTSVTEQIEKYSRPYAEWTLRELLDDLRHHTLPVRRTNAQRELVNRGSTAADALISETDRADLPAGAPTWLIWTLAQIPEETAIDAFLIRTAGSQDSSASERTQALKALGFRTKRFRIRLPEIVSNSLKDPNPRIRFAAIQAVQESRADELADELWQMVSTEQDRATFYTARVTLGLIQKPDHLRQKLSNGTTGQRRAALLTLLEQAALTGDDVLPLRLDTDPAIASIAASFLSKVGTSQSPVLSIEPPGRRLAPTTPVQIVTGTIPDGLHVRYSIDGTEPTDTTGKKYTGPFHLTADTTVSASLFKGRERMGPVLRREFSVIAENSSLTSTSQISDRVYPIEVTDINVDSGQAYRISTLQPGRRTYANREYTWTRLPDDFSGHTFLQPRNSDSDAGSTGQEFLSFTITEPADVYIAHDRRIDPKPNWLAEFRPSGMAAATRDTTYDLFVKTFPAGRVTLGGNTRDGNPSQRSQYVTLLKPAPLQNRETATTIAESLRKLPSSDFRRGARLFFDLASCAKCHRMGNRGKALAPDLTSMGTRAAPETIAESILKPSAVIMEGFHSVAVATDAGRTFNGFIKQESGLNVELVQADGRVITIPRASIEQRRRQQVSVMPEGLSRQLSPQQVADLIRFILDAGKSSSSLKKTNPAKPATLEPQPHHEGKVVDGSASGEQNSATPNKRLASTSAVNIENDGTSLKIRCGDNEIATYFYRHNKVLRPFFAHVKVPSGTQVTRNFPPAPQDRQDHPDMHPGLWMGFGDISSEDFWRNKGRVVHEGLTINATGNDGRGSFSQRKSYQRADGSIVCSEQFQCTIHTLKEGYLLLWDATFSAPSGGSFYFGDQEEMGLGIRVAHGITEMNNGQITDSEGRHGAANIWSQPSAWCDYSGQLGEEPLGITILCHPENFRESWMHARNYGLIAANPFGRKAMNKGAASRIVVKDGQPLRLRYGILLHGATPDLDRIHQQYVKMSNETP